MSKLPNHSSEIGHMYSSLYLHKVSSLIIFKSLCGLLISVPAQEAQARFARARLCLPYNKGRKETLRPK
jgi:hypothetical protein